MSVRLATRPPSRAAHGRGERPAAEMPSAGPARPSAAARPVPHRQTSLRAGPDRGDGPADAGTVRGHQQHPSSRDAGPNSCHRQPGVAQGRGRKETGLPPGGKATSTVIALRRTGSPPSHYGIASGRRPCPAADRPPDASGRGNQGALARAAPAEAGEGPRRASNRGSDVPIGPLRMSIGMTKLDVDTGYGEALPIPMRLAADRVAVGNFYIA